MQQSAGAPRLRSVGRWVWTVRILAYLVFVVAAWWANKVMLVGWDWTGLLVAGLLPAWYTGALTRLALTDSRSLIIGLPGVVGGLGLVFVPEYRYPTALFLAFYLAWLQVGNEKQEA